MDELYLDKVITECRDNRFRHPDRTIQQGKTVLKNIEQSSTGKDRERGKLHQYIGAAFSYKHSYENAVFHHQETLKIGIDLNDHELISDAKLSFASTALLRGDYHSAAIFLEEACSFQKTHHLESKEVFTVHMLGTAQIFLEHYESAEVSFKYCLELCEKHPREKDILKSSALVNLGIIHVKFARHGEAKKYFKQAQDEAERVNDEISLANSNFEIGKLNQSLGDHEVAAKLFLEAEGTFRKHNKEYDLPEIMHARALLLTESDFAQRNLSEATKILKDALLIAQTTENTRFQIRILKTLSSIKEQQNDPKAALSFLKKAIKTEENIQKEKAQVRLENLHIIHEVDAIERKHQIERTRREALQESNNRLKSLLEERKAFMGLAAHDLRNPISAIFGIIDCLKDHECSQIYEDVTPITELLELSASNALSIVTNILEDNRLEEGNFDLTFEKIDLAKICLEIEQLYLQKAANKNIQFRFQGCDQTAFSHVDEFSIKQAVDNLVSNGIKFCNKDDTVTLNLRIDHASRMNEIRVIDNGPGMSEEDQKKLFQRFAKMSNDPTANEASSGLGLSIVKKLVELNNGTILCESQKRVGSTFTIRLPIA
ncbi:MAG: ATP-binding protein [Opitutales bacterium]|nr:ATP-binding protein [Opitutales bacterium]